MIELSSPTLQVGVLGFGARISHLRTPDRDGRLADITLGFDTDEDWRADPTFQGATIGRVANRITGGRFSLDGREYRVPVNDGDRALHGGPAGFDQQDWEIGPVSQAPDGGSVTLSRISPDGEMGFPGTLRVTVTLTVRGDDLVLDHRADTDAPTLVNLTNHAYFNLTGRPGPVAGHLAQIFADRYLPVRPDLMPTGELASLTGTPLDFRLAQPIGARWRQTHPQLAISRGHDHTYVLDASGGAVIEPDGRELRRAARVVEPESGRTLEVLTDQPGVQFYSGNMLDGSLRTRIGLARQGDAFCLEPQHFPDSPNQPAFPSIVLRPGEEYRHLSIFRFGLI